MPPIRQNDPQPSSGSIDGFAKTQAQGCKQCVLTVARGISASGAKLYREQGTISFKECGQFRVDSQKVNNREMALTEFKTKLLAGKYFNDQGNGFCAQMMFREDQIQDARSINEIPWNQARNPAIRKLTSSGGYSSLTKLFIKPAIPFNVSFNGQQITVSVMTIFHPCPIRIENVQADAVLTLGDAGDQTVIMIPLEGSLASGGSGSFISKIASYIPGVLLPSPATGQYEAIDVPTGKDWDLSKVFPGTPNGEKTVVDVPYYVWNATPPLELYLRETVQSPMWLPNIEKYGWRPATNQPTSKFIVLEKAVPVNSFDLQTIRMLPATPPEEAIPPPYMKSLIYKSAATCDAGRERFTEKMDECDPLAQLPSGPRMEIDTDTILMVLLGIISTVAVFIGIYFAMKYATGPTGSKFKEWGEKFGKMLSGMGRKLPTPAVLTPIGVFEEENPLVTAKREEDAKAAAAAAKVKAKADAEAAAEAAKKAKEEERAKVLAEREAAGQAVEDRLQKEAEDRRAQKAKDEAKAKADAEQKARDEERAKEEAARKLFDEQESKKKELKDKMSDTSLSEEEQRRIRREYQKLTGMYIPTKKEQEAAAGTGLIKKRIIAPEPEDEPEVKAFNPFTTAPPPRVPIAPGARALGTRNLGTRASTAKAPTPESAAPPRVPDMKAVEARLLKVQEDRKKQEEQQKDRLAKARERIDAAMTNVQERKMKEQLADLKAKQAEDREKLDKELNDRIKKIKEQYVKKYETSGTDKEKAARDFAEAQARLRSSMAVYRRGQQGRNIHSGRGKTRRNRTR